MTTPAFEAFLAKLYTDAVFRAKFLSDPQSEAKKAGLTEPEAEALANIDKEGLELAAATFEAKRKKKLF